MGHIRFPDMREFHLEIAQKIREWAEYEPSPYCGALLLQEMPHQFGCKPFGDRIQENLLPPIVHGLLNHINELTRLNRNFSHMVNDLSSDM
jgi:hypothetical protein